MRVSCFSVYCSFVCWTLPECFLYQFLDHLPTYLSQMGHFPPLNALNYDYSSTDSSSFSLRPYQKSAQDCTTDSHLIENIVPLNSSGKGLQNIPTKLFNADFLAGWHFSFIQLALNNVQVDSFQVDMRRAFLSLSLSTAHQVLDIKFYNSSSWGFRIHVNQSQDISYCVVTRLEQETCALWCLGLSAIEGQQVTKTGVTSWFSIAPGSHVRNLSLGYLLFTAKEISPTSGAALTMSGLFASLAVGKRL